MSDVQESSQQTPAVRTDIPKNSHVIIRYRDESLPLIGMHNSCHSNCNLDTKRVTRSVGNSCGDEGEDETVSQRQTDREKLTSLQDDRCVST